MGSMPAVPATPVFSPSLPPAAGYFQSPPLPPPPQMQPQLLPPAVMPGGTPWQPLAAPPPPQGLAPTMTPRPGGYLPPTAYQPLTLGPNGSAQMLNRPGLVNGPISISGPSPVAEALEIASAMNLLAGIQHLPGDEAYLRSLGVDILYKNGMEAYQTIRNKGIRVVFGDMGDSKAHAQWIREQNTIMINQKYQGDMSPETLYAISEAIYHEAGHVARLGDDQASIQEELNALALNVLGYRYHTAIDPNFALSASQSRLIQDGVALYARLFFDPDPAKQGLVNRMIEKYGTLQPESPDHQIPAMPPGAVAMTDRVCRQLQTAHVQGWQAYS
ncbi:MAG: hypothetical protein AB7P76_03260 [Candidatus Melainabacteria bacterium]